MRAGTNVPLDELLRELRVRRWTLYRWGRADDPVLLAGLFRWPSERQGDVILLRPDGSASAYRAPLFCETGLFKPSSVFWEYHCDDAFWTMRGILSLPPPRHPQAPLLMYTPRGACAAPEGLPSPVMVRPLGVR